MIYTNEFMHLAINEIESYNSPNRYNKIELNKFFKKIWPNFEEINGCIINNKDKMTYQINISEIIKQFGSIEGFEDFDGHIHIINIISCSIKQTLKFGLVIKEIWKNRSETLFPDYSFKFILFYDAKEKYNTILRFYRVRENGIDLYPGDEIESYKKLGLLIETIGKYQ